MLTVKKAESYLSNQIGTIIDIEKVWTIFKSFGKERMQATEWYFDSDGDVEEFYSGVESLEEFKIPLKYTPLKLTIYQEEV